jgi:autotransporter-associated beta strand protein
MNWLKNGVADWFVSRDTVCFTDLGILYNEVNLQGNLFTGLVKIEAEGDYVFNGPGSITGTGGLVKKKSGKLIIRNNNDYTGATLINEGIIEVERLGNSGEPGPLGSGTSNPYNLLLDGGTLRITGSSASDRDIGLGQGNGVVDITGTELRLNGIFYGEGQLIKTGSGTLTCTMANTHQLGTLIEEGRVYLGTETANISGPGPGPVTILNGRLSMLDDRNSYTDSCDWHLVIPQGGKARLELDSRCSLTGTLTGSGILDLSIPFIRSELFGDWSSFTGKINAFTSSSSASFIAGNVTGLPGADIQLDDNILLLYRHTASDTIPLGSLSGTAASRLGAGGEGNAVITWRIGTNNSNAQFSGIICNDQFKNEGAVASIIKSGTGAWTLTGSNTYSGNTTLEKGTLWIRNRTGSGTGYGPVTVLGGATLGGNGRVSGPVIIEQNGILFPGPLPGSVFISDSTVLVKNGGMLAFEVDPLNKSSALLRVISKLTMNGYIYFTNSGSLRLAAGDVFTLADAGQIDGQPEGIIPLSPGEGLQWDVSEWKNKGIIKVKLATGDRKIFSPPSFLIYPNPAVESLNILLAEEDPDTRICIENLHGQKIMEIKTNNQLYLNLRIEHLAPGMYFVKRLNGRSVIARKFIKK